MVGTQHLPRVTALLFATALAACQQPPAAPPEIRHAPIGRETVSYRGDVPCADCPGQRLTVTLFPDQTYRLQRIYLGADAGHGITSYSLGRWARAQDDGANRLRLSGDAGTPLNLRIIGTDTLRLLDTRGNDITSPHNHNLKRLAQPDIIAGPMPLRGMYAYMADAASFQECRTGKRYPVLMTRDHAALERAYLAGRTTPGAPILAVIEGSFVALAPEPGMAAREHVVVERHLVLRPGETCAADALARASLSNTYWRPVEIDGKPVAVRPGAREPHLVLESNGLRARGFSGCNNFTGGYEHSGENLRFKAMAATRMACLDDSNTEQRFLAALNNTASQRVTGDALELRDRDGKVQARFEARYLR